jgi:hypothetical protein
LSLSDFEAFPFFCGGLIKKSKHQQRWQGEPPFLFGQVHGDQSQKQCSGLGLVAVVGVKDFGVQSFDAREAFLYIS